MTLCGVTAVEDLLQRDVGQCLSDFKSAGIKTWMLTGDKGETARMIGLLCGMLSCAGKMTVKGTVFKQLEESELGDTHSEFEKLDELVRGGVNLEIRISGARLGLILKEKKNPETL